MAREAVVAQSLGEHVRQRRGDLRLSQADLGKRMGYDKSYISHIELNRAKRASFALLQQLADALEEPVEDLLAAIGEEARLREQDDLTLPQQRIIAFTRARLAHLTDEQAERLVRSVEAAFGEQAPD